VTHITTTNRLPAGFRRLVWSNLAAQSAEQIGLAAAPIVAVLALGADAGATGWLQTAQTLPFLLFSIPAGVLADRWRRGHLMAAAEALRVSSLLGIVVLGVLHALTLPGLALLGFIGACGTVTYSVTAPALVPALVPATALAAANARIELARTVAFAAGPALAGGLAGWIGGSSAFALAAALSACAVLLLAGVHEPPRPRASRRNPWHEVREGAHFVFRHALLAPIFATQFVFNTGFFMLQAVYVPYAVHRLGLSGPVIGITLAAYGFGMVGGALLAPRVARTVPFGVMVAIGPLAGLAASAAMAATIVLPNAALAGASFMLMGGGPILWVISTTTLRQTVTPPALLGRVSAINSIAYGARPLGAALGGTVGALCGADVTLLMAVALFAVQAAVILASPVVQLASQPALSQ
jgi:predicted MFS family arabinose efflux permease